MNPKGKPENLKNWPKGVSGNPKGRPKSPPELKEILIKLANEEKSGITLIEEIAKAVAAKAKKGDMKSVEWFIDRIYGKIPQAITTEGNAVTVRVVYDDGDTGQAQEAASGPADGQEPSEEI